MKGFDTRILVIPPDPISYEAKNSVVQNTLANTLKNIPTLFQELFDMKAHVCATTMLPCMFSAKYQVIGSTCREDIEFIRRREVSGISVPTYEEDEFEKIRLDVAKRYPVERGMPEVQRITVVNKRDKAIVKGIADEFLAVLTFEPESKAKYAIKSKEGNGKILIRCDSNTLMCTAYMSGQRQSTGLLLNNKSCHQPMNIWRVEN